MCSDNDIVKYRDLVYKVYNRYYAKHFKYLEDDLIQCGYWGLFLAHQKYDSTRGKKFINYAFDTIHNKMWQYIDHEKHHITKDHDEECDFTKVGMFKDITTLIDIKKATRQLTKSEKSQLHEWLNYTQFNEMGFSTKQTAQYHFKKILNKLKESLKYEL